MLELDVLCRPLIREKEEFDSVQEGPALATYPGYHYIHRKNRYLVTGITTHLQDQENRGVIPIREKTE